jgi:hypothetical protein
MATRRRTRPWRGWQQRRRMRPGSARARSTHEAPACLAARAAQRRTGGGSRVGAGTSSLSPKGTRPSGGALTDTTRGALAPPPCAARPAAAPPRASSGSTTKDSSSRAAEPAERGRWRRQRVLSAQGLRAALRRGAARTGRAIAAAVLQQRVGHALELERVLARLAAEHHGRAAHDPAVGVRGQGGVLEGSTRSRAGSGG